MGNLKRTPITQTGPQTPPLHVRVLTPIMSDHFCAKCVEVCLCGLKSLVYFTFSCASPASCNSLSRAEARCMNTQTRRQIRRYNLQDEPTESCDQQAGRPIGQGAAFEDLTPPSHDAT